MTNWPTIKTALEAGDVVILPTETVYGIAADAQNPSAISKIYALKGRNFDKPLAVCVKNQAQAQKLAVFNDIARDLAARYWPGSLTLVLDVLPNSHLDPRALGEMNGETTIALRCPDANWVEHLDFPIALTSANTSGHPDSTEYGAAITAFDGQISVGLSATAPLSGAPSTIVRVDADKTTVLRQGKLEIS